MALSSPLTRGIELLDPGESDAAAQELRMQYLLHETGFVASADELLDAHAQQTGYVLVKSASGRCVALMKLTHAGPLGFEIESRINPSLYVPISNLSIEVSELIVDSTQRSSLVTLQLALGFAGYLKRHAPDTLFAISTKETAAHYDRLGMTVRWDLLVPSTWRGVDMWLCYAHPATVVLQRLIDNTPPVYKNAVVAYLDGILLK